MRPQSDRPIREFEQVRAELENVVTRLRMNFDPGARKRLLRELRQLIAEAYSLLSDKRG